LRLPPPGSLVLFRCTIQDRVQRVNFLQSSVMLNEVKHLGS
jgi:hypothetical protein